MEEYMESVDLVPDAVEYLMVGILRHGEFNYYVLPRILLFLDYLSYIRKRFADFDPKRMSYPGMAERFNIFVVDEEKEPIYMQGLMPYKRGCERLRKEMSLCSDPYERDCYYPCVMIDFDRKNFVSNYWEPYPFEEYVPAGWTSVFRRIEETEIPEDKRFWIDEKGRNLFEELLKEE